MRDAIDTGKVAEIATFLARCWSNDPNVVVSFSRSAHASGGTIYVPSIESLGGKPLDRYRQMRVSIWHASMKRRLSRREMSGDHAFGFVLNVLEVRRAERIGLQQWRGMAGEVIFNYAFQWMYRPLLNSVYGRPRIAEAFLQHFLFGDVKGDITERQLSSVARASAVAKAAVDAAVSGDDDALEDAVPNILCELELDPITTIPIAFPWSRPNMPLDPDDLKDAIKRVTGTMGAPQRAPVITPSSQVFDEFESLLGKMPGGEELVRDGISVPSCEDVNEAEIYDYELIARLKTKFRDWKSKWTEARAAVGDELDVESYIETDARSPFVTDSRRESSADVMMLLDHSSSIATVQVQYKKAALALCEVLAQLRARFSVYAFSTFSKSVVCWEVKRATQRWDSTCARRLTQIAANGSTPLAEVYSTMRPVLDSERPETFLTMTDGEPSDPRGVIEFVVGMRRAGVRMAALGLGADVVRATAIADNLKRLGYERVLAASRLSDIPGKVLGILGE